MNNNGSVERHIPVLSIITPTNWSPGSAFNPYKPDNIFQPNAQLTVVGKGLPKKTKGNQQR